MAFDSRQEMARQYKNNWGDMLKEYPMKYGSFAAGLQAQSPFPDMEVEPVNAISSLCQRLGIVLRDDKKEGIQSSTLNYIFEENHRGHAWAEAVRENHHSRIKGHSDIPTRDELAYTIEDFTPGRGFRPFEFTNVRDDDMFRVWPPLEYIVSRVERQAANDIDILEYTTDPNVEGSVEWDGVGDIPVDVIKETDSPVAGKWLAGGIKMSQEARRSMSTSERVMLYTEKRSRRARQKIADEVLALVSTGVTTTKDVGLAGTPNVETIVGIGTAFETKEYKVTTLFGRTAKVDEYLAIDRSGLSQNAGMSTTAGMVVGGDMYGDSGVMRMVFDVSTSQIANRGGSGNNGIDADEFLGIDVMETAEVYIVAGTDTVMEEDITRSRAWELTWTLKYIPTLMVKNPLGRIRLE